MKKEVVFLPANRVAYEYVKAGYQQRGKLVCVAEWRGKKKK